VTITISVAEMNAIRSEMEGMREQLAYYRSHHGPVPQGWDSNDLI
jgi:hypothetical protein